MRASAGSGTGYHIIHPVAIDVACRNIDPTRKQRVVGVEAANLLPARTAEHPYVRASAGSGTGDPVKNSVLIKVPLRNANTTSEGGIVGIKLILYGPISGRENPHMRTSASASTCDDIEVVIQNYTVDASPSVDYKALIRTLRRHSHAG